jgi:uncharacterized protein YjbI with pentapeptide repeats/glucose/arabinose dehydrogenase
MRIFLIIIALMTSIGFGLAEGSLETDDVCGDTISNDSKFPPVSSDPHYKIEKFVSNLDWPTTMTFVGSDILVLQKNNGLVCHVNNGVLEKIPARDVEVNSEGERGLLGITSRDMDVFLFFTEANSDGGDPIGNHIYRYLWNGFDLTEGELIKKLPGDVAHAHVGGVMTTGLDGTIFAVTGDNRNEGRNQNFDVEATNNDSSTIFSIEPMEEHYAIGIRNSFGITIDPVTGNMWDTENGPKHGDEINLVLPKFNSGWKKIMGPANEKEQLSINIPGFQYSDPEFSWDIPVAPTAISFVESELFPELKNSILVGDFNTGNLYEFKLNEERIGFVFEDPLFDDLIANQGEPVNEIIFATGFSGITDIEVGPDGMIYVVSIGDGTIYKISPLDQHVNLENQVPCNVKPEVRSKLSGCDLSGLSLQNRQFTFQDLSNVNLSGSNLTGTSFLNSNLTGAILSGADMSNVDLTNAILTNAILQGTNIRDSQMYHTIFEGANLQNVKMTNSKLADANFNHANLTNADLSNTNLAYASIKNADLEGINLSFSNLNYALLIESNLQGSDLSKIDIYLANFSGSDFSNSKILGVYPYSTDFSNVIFSSETQTDSCLNTDDLSRFFNKLLREIRNMNLEFLKPFESLIVQICKP